MTQTKHIEMRGVRKAFRFFTLDDLSLDLEPGQIMGFVGPNGAGKSTTIRLAMGLLAPDAGEVRVLGHAMPEAPGRRQARHRFRFRRDAPVAARHARLAHAVHRLHLPGLGRGVRAGAGEALQPAPRAERRAACRCGEHVKAVLLLALARRPRLLILDEPTTGLDPVARHEVLSEFMDVLRDDRPLDPLLLAQHRRRGAHLRPHHLHRSRPRWSTAATRKISSSAGAASRCRLPPGTTLPELPHVVSRVVDGQFVTLTTNRFSDGTARAPRLTACARCSA